MYNYNKTNDFYIFSVLSWNYSRHDILFNLSLLSLRFYNFENLFTNYSVIITPLPEGGGGYNVLPQSVLPSVQDIFRPIFLSNCWWQKSDIWSQASYRYTILWVAFLDPSDSYFLFAEERGYHKWALAHSSSCLISNFTTFSVLEFCPRLL